MSLFSMTPTFTQGLVVGQLSILLLLVIIVRHLFLDSAKTQPVHTPAPLPVRPPPQDSEKAKTDAEGDWRTGDAETAEWFNLLLNLVRSVFQRSYPKPTLTLQKRNSVCKPTARNYERIYRELLGMKLHGPESKDGPTQRCSLISWHDNIVIHSVDLGMSAPRISEARLVPDLNDPNGFVAECNLSYIDSVSVSLSTSVLFNYPVPLFARLPVSLTLSLSLFSGNATIKPPSPTAIAPSVTLTLSPHFHLELRTTSLLGSRAKLADVPKIHQMLEERIKRAISDRATWKFMLPGLAARTAREGIPDTLL
ncbi:unnamed protein product [Rhizoctonia solani]|uniref:SMP-LTD domain-containing protein n=1 Tax=Rhizoctonia solani TaxID=456999 RepID=A0A8H3GZQ8_9AGAM|nr:unnamed protein product [Rhizoctonia solani]